MLIAEGVHKSFAGLTALDHVDVTVNEHEIVGLIGPNGSGKSTLLAVLSGFLRADAGTVTFRGHRIDHRAPWDIARRGLRRTFQLPRQPLGLTVLEVMLSGAHLPIGDRARSGLLRRRAMLAEEAAAAERARRILDELTLLPLQHHSAGTLSGGQQKLLSIGAALMTQPRMLLLDEPTAGVHPNLRHVLIDRLFAVRDAGTALVIVEHDMGFVRRLCERAYVLDKGSIVTSCAPAELAKDPRVVEAYLGSRSGISQPRTAGEQLTAPAVRSEARP
jgi:ABC-type branched-subunit amino acid transport system ATPase component